MSLAFPFLPAPPPARALASALMLAAALGAGPASAADALRGKSLYLSTPGGISCANSSCHGTNVSANKNKVLRGANNPTTIQNAINRDTGGMGIYRNNVLTATDVADIAAYLGNPNVSAGPVATVTPASLAFGTVAVGSTSTVQTVTLRNSGTAALTVATIAVSNAAFVIAGGGSCAAGGSVAAGGSCTVNLQFRPTAAAAASGSLTITHNAAPATSTVSLSGTGGGVAAAAVTPNSLSFGSVATGSRSAVQTATVQNSGSAAPTLSTISVSNTQFRITGGSCAAGGTVAAGGGSCTVLVDFGPTATGAASANLSIAHNASASPLLVALSGSGTVPAAPGAQLSPATLTWSQVINTTSTAQTASLSNTGTAPLAITRIGLSGAASADYTIAAGSTCAAGGSIAAGASCSLNLSFRPSATGTRAASLSVVHNAAGSPSTLNLSGTGTAQASGQIAVNRLSLSYAAQPFGSSSAAQTVTVSNSGSASLTIASLAFAGSHAGDFATTPGSDPCTSGRSLAVAASCTVDVLFTPTASSGTRTATLVVSAGSAGSVSVGLSGIAAAAAAPIVSLTPASLNFGSVAIGSSAASQTSVLANGGTASLSIASLRAAPAVYSLSHDCPATLAAGSRCTLTVGFTPAAPGAVSGSVAIASNAATTPDTLALSGTGVTPVPAALGWVGGSTLSFPDTASGAQSAPQALQLGNSGTSPAALGGFSFAGSAAADYLIDPSSSCATGGSLAGGARCTLQVVFAPASVGARDATLSVTSSNATVPAPASLSGNGVAGGTPLLVLSPTVITLTSLPNQPLQPQVLVIGNQGAGPLNVTAEQASDGLALLDAASTGGGSCRPVPFVLAPGASCTLVINPLADVVNGTVSVFSDSAAAPAQATVTGSASKNLGAAGSAGPGLVALLAALALVRRRKPAPRG